MNKKTTAYQTLYTSWRLIGNDRKKLPIILVGSILMSLLDLLSIALFGPLIASIVSPELIMERSWYVFATDFLDVRGANPIIVIAVTLIIVFVAKFVWATFFLRKLFNFCADLDRSLRHQLLERYYARDLTSLAESSSANLVQAVHGFTSQFSYGLIGAQLRSFTEIIVGVLILFYLLYLNLLAVLILVVLIGCLVIIYDNFLRKKIHSFGRDSVKFGEILISSVQQIMLGIREIRVYGVDKRLLRNAKDAADSFSRLNASYQWVQSLPKYLIEFFLILVVCFLIILLQYENIPKEDVFGLIGVFAVALMRLTPGFNYVLSSLSQIRFIDFVVCELAKSLLEQKIPTQANKKVKTQFFGSIESIELKNIAFKYSPGSKELFSSVDLKILKGESIGIIGPSGAGKSSLVELILGLREPTDGEVLINDKLSNSYEKELIIKNFAYIPQQLFMIDGSVKDNITLLDDSVDVDERVMAAVSSAQLSNYVASLPYGIDTQIGENGGMLSGGQRQRIALARAFYHKRSVLIMDEATSALDFETEKEIIREVRDLKGRVTLIVIAHRLETVFDCDRIFRVDDSKVVEISHEEIKDLLR